MIDSRNVPIIRLAMQIGRGVLFWMWRATCGHRGSFARGLGLWPWWTSEVFLLELTGGLCDAEWRRQKTQRSLGSIECHPWGRTARFWKSHPSVREKMFSPEPIYLVTQMLEAVLDVGTGKAARAMGLTGPAAGKTGTSENYQDAWFIGYTTNLVGGVWVGYDIPKSLGRSAAAHRAALVDLLPMKKAVRAGPSFKTLKRPKGPSLEND